MNGKRIVQIIINSCLGLFSIEIIYEASRETQPITAIIFVMILVYLFMIIFSTALNIKILKKYRSTAKESKPKFNSALQFVFLFIAGIFLLFALLSPSFTGVMVDPHGNLFFDIDFGTLIYPVGQEGIYFFYALLLLVVSFAALVNSNLVEPDNLRPSLLDTSLNRRLVNSHLLLGALTLAFSLIYCIWLTRSLVGVIMHLNGMAQEMYETLIIWDIVLDFVRRYIYSVPFVLYGRWVLKDGLRLKQSLIKEIQIAVL